LRGATMAVMPLAASDSVDEQQMARHASWFMSIPSANGFAKPCLRASLKL
jgi:hypothetical protein